MSRKIRNTVPVLAAVVACMAAALPTSAFAAKSAKTKVTIDGPNGDFFGKVKSKDPLCVEGREVIVFEMEGSKPKPSTDVEVASDSAGSDGRWSVGQPGVDDGTYYAHAPKVPGCKAGTSKTIDVER